MHHRLTFAALMTTLTLAVAVPAAQAQDPDLPPWPPCGPVQNVVPGGNNNPNFLPGTAVNDLINAFAGDDELLGFDGNDILNGGPGDDLLYGHRGQ